MNEYKVLIYLIYNKMSRRPVLVIEVDGVSFHEQQKAQQERDAKKNSILEKAGIRLLRLKTNESGEEEKIGSQLNLLKKSPLDIQKNIGHHKTLKDTVVKTDYSTIVL